jgi:hypothetical protein
MPPNLASLLPVVSGAGSAFVDVVELAGTENQPIGKHASHAPRNGIDA